MYAVVYDKKFTIDVPYKWICGEPITKREVVTDWSGTDYFTTLSEAKEFAKTKKSITNKKYVNIRIFEITDEEYKKEDGIPDYNYKQPILIL